MEVRADKFLSGHYAYFIELPQRKALEERVDIAKELGNIKKAERLGSFGYLVGRSESLELYDRRLYS